MADTPLGETVTPGDSQTNGTQPTTPQVNVDTAEVERLRKENEQRDIRIRQLENERQAREAADRETEAKRLKENEEYKQLYERTNTELENIRKEREAQEQQTRISAATNDVFKDYPETVQQVAKTTGLSLSDDSELARAALKEKLDQLQQVVGTGAPTVSSNNPTPTTPVVTGQPVNLGRPRQLGIDNGTVAQSDTNPEKFSAYVKGIPAIEQMKRQAGLIN